MDGEYELLATIVGLILTGIVTLFSLIKYNDQQSKLLNSYDESIIYSNQLMAVSKLAGDFPFVIVIFRNSGYINRSLVCNNSTDALKKAFDTLRRAKIECIEITKNTENIMCIRRGHEIDLGSRSGKKVGIIEIHKIPYID